jgi:maltooligosyltrehalose trehalohydrolase
MGQEYGEERPFPFFCSFGDEELIKSVREGRSREFAGFAWQGEVPDPQSPETYASARLTWSWPEGSNAFRLRTLYRDLLAARRWPALRDYSSRSAGLLPDPKTGPILELERGHPGSSQLHAFFNLAAVQSPLPSYAWERVGTGTTPLFSSELSCYGGSRVDLESVTHLLAFECIVFGPEDWRTRSSKRAEH